MKVHPKYMGLVLPSIQQLWYREAQVDDKTTMSGESMCQVSGGQFPLAFIWSRVFRYRLIPGISG
jgi:hypothetical protein